jgi:hypothetical protein
MVGAAITGAGLAGVGSAGGVVTGPRFGAATGADAAGGVSTGLVGAEFVVTGFGVVATGAAMFGGGGSVFVVGGFDVAAVTPPELPKSGGGGSDFTTTGGDSGFDRSGCGAGVVVGIVAAGVVAATAASLFSPAGGVASACAATGSSVDAAGESPRCHFKPAQAPTATRKAPATPMPSFVSRVMGDPSSVEPLLTRRAQSGVSAEQLAV